MYNDETMWALIKNNFMQRELIEEQEGRVTAMRSFMLFGFPIETDEKRYKDLLDEVDE